MQNPIHPCYFFGEYSVDVAERQLLRSGETVSLPPKVFDTLLVLVENQGRILEKDWLMQQIWPDSFVEESSLAQYVFQLRKTLRDEAGEHHFIETIPKRGYRFIAPVAAATAAAAPPENNTALALPHLNGKAVALPASYGADAAHLALLSEGNSHNQVAKKLVVPPPAAPAFASSVPALNGFASLSSRALHPHSVWHNSRRLNISWVTTTVVAVMISLIVGMMVFGKFFRPTASLPAPTQITKLTSTGRATTPAISPDGKYVAYVVDDLGKQGLWIRQTETLSNVQVQTPSEVSYQGLTFSPDANYLFYVVYKMPKHIGVLYRVPILGGTAQKILEDVDTSVSFSPDGKQFSFVRQYPATLETAVMLANADGTNETKLATRKMPQSYAIDGLSWSPDGGLIAIGASDIGASGTTMSLLGIRLQDGKEARLSTISWGNLKQVAWNREGCGLLAIGWQQAAPVMANQVWYIPFPTGEPRRVTNDLMNYNGLSYAKDSGKLVTTQSTKVSRLWLVQGNNTEQATPAASVGIDYFSERLGLNWLPDGRLIYGSRASGNADIWLMNPDGSNQKQLTVESSVEGQPTVSPDGRYVAFLSNRAGTFNIWRMDADGTHAKQLTTGPWENSPSFTPDGQWVVYNGTMHEKPVLLKVPADGGTPIQLTEEISLRPAVSPDGKLVAHLHMDEQTQRMKLAVVPLEGDHQVKMFDATIPEPYIINWSPDGKMMTYVDTRDGVSNVWGHPLDGSQAKPLTNFKSDHIFRFAWSGNGKTMACERGFYLNDVVLIGNIS